MSVFKWLPQPLPEVPSQHGAICIRYHLSHPDALFARSGETPPGPAKLHPNAPPDISSLRISRQEIQENQHSRELNTAIMHDFDIKQSNLDQIKFVKVRS
jgi:hypothetical protein